MKYVLVLPMQKSVLSVECKEMEEALELAKLDGVGLDHGVVLPGMGIVVYEFGMYEPVEKLGYFSIGKRLYAGNAVLYGYSQRDGIDTSLETVPEVVFYATAEAVERAIENGSIDRPHISVNDELIWEWPQGMPEGIRDGK
jgi:hypothetical protein